jgi:NADH:ubiquinone oxidoreductase subunit 6 (subunit J)
VDEDVKKAKFSSFLILIALISLLCFPWIAFLLINYKGQPMMDPFHTEGTGTLGSIIYWILHDWVLHVPLIIASLILLVLLPFFSRNKKNVFSLLAVCFLPIGGVYLICKVVNISHFITSRYFINLLPLFLISIYLSLTTIESKFERFRQIRSLTILFVIFFIASNLIILPLYYQSGKQDFRGLVAFLTSQLKEGDKVFVTSHGYIPGILHYLRVYPEGRHYFFPVRRDDENKVEFIVPFIYKNRAFNIYHSKNCCTQFVLDKNRLWIVAEKQSAKEIKKLSPFIMKGYFDGSFLNFTKFPDDGSMYLFLWDPKSPREKGIDIPIE